MDEFDAPGTREGNDLQELLARRERIEDWLARLARETGTNERVVARVRNDYLKQLREVLDQMAEHRETIRARARMVRDEVQRATEAADEARDALEEAELRNRIGELGPEEWNARRTQLESRATLAVQAGESLRAELDELDRVLQAIDAETGEDADASELTLEAPAVVLEDAPSPRVEGVTTSEALSQAEDPDEAEDDFLATRPGPGLKCPRCGYKNDVGAVYCGVCGVQLA